jgi:hypothetical protein
MRFLTVDRFQKLGSTIPNLTRLDPKYRIEVTPFDNNNIITSTTIYYDNVDVLSMSLGESWSGSHTFNEDYNTDFFISKGIATSGVRSVMTILDSLYHFANGKSKKLKDLNDSQRKTWYHAYYVRLGKYYNHGSGYTEMLTKQLIEFITSRNNLNFLGDPNVFSPALTEEYLFRFSVAGREEFGRHFSSYNYAFDSSTDTVSPKSNLKRAYILVDGREQSIFYSNFDKILEKYNVIFNENRSTFYDPTKYTYSQAHRRWITLDGLDLVTCNSCGSKVYKLDIVGTFGCNNCLAHHGKIHTYSTRVPSLLPFKLGKQKISKTIKPLYLGIELEYESDNREIDAKITTKLLDNHAILKQDGSIRHGFEIVSCPATLDSHLSEYKSFFDAKEKHTTLKGSEQTGMHVHVSRSPLSSLTVGKLTAFFNNPDNLYHLCKIGGRTLNHYCRQVPERKITFKGAGERHVILNLTNKDTIELRMFSSPENYDNFKSKLEFTQAVVKYCSPASTNLSLKEIVKFYHFSDYVMRNAKDYPNLATIIKGL